jgi:outer membrane protein assembly factor BamA
MSRGMTKWLLLAGFIPFILHPSYAWAADQDDQNPPPTTRTALLTEEREKKATTSAPPERTTIERGLHWYDNQHVLANISSGWKGLRFASGNFAAGAGTGVGVGYTRGERIQLDTLAAYTTRDYYRFRVGLNLKNLAGKRVDVELRAQHYELPEEDFFGIGTASLEQNRTSYLLEGAEVGGTIRVRPVKYVDLTGGLSYVGNRTGSGGDPRYPSVEQVFAPGTLPGFGDAPDYIRTEIGGAFDWRDNALHPHSGGRYAVRLADYRDQNRHAYTFQRVDLDVHQYVPLPDRYRTLAFRATGTFTDASAGHDVPFFEQPALGGSQTLRGFREFRFRDRNSLALTAEYRWEAWWALDGALFVDAGTVAPHWRGLKLNDVDVTYGVGFRVHSNSAFVARLDFAFSKEGFIPLLRFEHVF